jgi:hypothetical protein
LEFLSSWVGSFFSASCYLLHELTPHSYKLPKRIILRVSHAFRHDYEQRYLKRGDRAIRHILNTALQYCSTVFDATIDSLCSTGPQLGGVALRAFIALKSPQKGGHLIKSVASSLIRAYYSTVKQILQTY